MVARTCIRITTLIFNLIFFVLSLVLLAIGIWILIDSNSLLGLVTAGGATVENDPANAYLIKVAGIAATTVGGFAALTSFFGCVGAWADRRCPLIIFWIIMCVVLTAVLFIAVGALACQDILKQTVKNVLYYNNKHSTGNDDPTSLLGFAVKKYECCGVESEALCHENFIGSQCYLGSEHCKYGCFDAVWNNMIAPYLNGIVVVLFILAAVIVCGLVFAMCLICTSPERQQTNAG